MGVRLYPITKDPSSLEKLAGVSAGTYARLELHRQFEEAAHYFAGEDAEDAGYLSHVWRHDVDKELGVLSDFLIYGWGKFNLPTSIPVLRDVYSEWDPTNGGGEHLYTEWVPDHVGWEELGKTRSRAHCIAIIEENYSVLHGVSLSLAKGFCWG